VVSDGRKIKTLRDSIVAIATGYWLDGWGFDCLHGQEIFLFLTTSRPALGRTQPPIQWVPGDISPGLKRPKREADHSPPSSAEVKNGGATPPLPRSHGVVLN
jgi:hypothetical protein